jgi:hypothetical protein
MAVPVVLYGCTNWTEEHEGRTEREERLFFNQVAVCILYDNKTNEITLYVYII